MTPQPWPRTGPGAARDGKPKFDLAQFDRAYFDRLRDRVVAAGNQGIYVAVMLFEGFSLHLTAAPDNVEGHPFHAANNVNGIGIGSIDDYQVLPLDPRVQALQEAYIRQVIDTVHDLPNVLYEVANESSGGGSVDRTFAAQLALGDATAWGDSTAWQYWVIDFVKTYEEQKGYQKHPVGMTMQYPVPDQGKVNDPLFNGPADWVSPGGGASPMEDQTPALDWLGAPRPTTVGRSCSPTPTTTPRARATRCGPGNHSSAATTRSCTTSGSWVARARPTRRRQSLGRLRTRPSSRPATPWGTRCVTRRR
jgi:hypothetical protein